MDRLPRGLAECHFGGRPICLTSICLITPGHLSSAPRVVKEASALAGAGYDVHVVAGNHFAPATVLDETLVAAASWQSHFVNYASPGYAGRKLARRLARLLVTQVPSPALAARALHAECLRFARIAANFPARLYLGHSLAGLVSAALAARKNSTAYGFDAEDFHDEETASIAEDPRERTIRRLLHQSFLPGCAHFTAASPLISDAYATRYGPRAIPVLNAFPLSEAPAPVDTPPVSSDRPAVFYWFSQTIGPGRGLEKVLSIMGRMRTPAALHLRGFVSATYGQSLRHLAQSLGLRHPITFLPPAAPGEMARLAATADLGLSTETPPPWNRDLCLTNKIFCYLLAGIPQLLSLTTAQGRIAADLGAAALLADLDQPDAAAVLLDQFFSNPARVRAARVAAFTASRQRYCWDLEKEGFLSSVRHALDSN